jgi:CheY-like chemotaxis protein
VTERTDGIAATIVEQTAAALATGTAAKLPGERPLVLIVDDEPELVRVTARFLAGANIDSIGCNDGAQALAPLDSHQVDAIISDVSMPKMTGIELVKAVRKRHLGLPVIMVTGGRSGGR